MSWQHLADCGYWLLFFLGQSLFVLKRAGSAIRNPTNPIKSRCEFVAANWDILLIRMVLETVTIFWLWRHVSIAQAFAWFSVPYPAWFPAGFSSSWVAPIAVGFCSDGLFDWIGQSPKVPNFIRQFIQEQVPGLPNGNGGIHAVTKP